MKIKTPASLGVRLVKGVKHTLEVPVEVRSTLGIHKGGKDLFEIVHVPTETRPLVVYGSTALDPTRLMRIRARFAPAEVVSIGQVPDMVAREKTGRTEFRELRSGDVVRKGDVLGVFYSVDVGNKKNDLYDAIVQLKLDEEILARAEAGRGNVPEIFILNAKRAVLGDRNAIVRAENTLRAWSIAQEEINEVKREAEKADDLDRIKLARTKNTKKEKDEILEKAKREQLDRWARVELRVPFDGIIVERNIVPHEIVQDPTINLFQIAQVKRLLVVANAPEDELPNLNALLPEQRKWMVKTVGFKAASELKGSIEEIGYLIDPNQHTAVIKGYIDNPKEHIRGGQFISATIRIPPPKDVVEIPLDAVVEDGQMCVVFVQPDPTKHNYTMRRVQLMHRFEKVAFVRSTPFTKEEKKLSAAEMELGLLTLTPLRPGERILTTGVGELKAALLELESRPATET